MKCVEIVQILLYNLETNERSCLLLSFGILSNLCLSLMFPVHENKKKKNILEQQVKQKYP